MQENNYTNLTFAERVNRLAGKLGGYSELASKMGLSRQTLYVAMSGEPSLKTLKKLTDVELAEMSEKDDAVGEPAPAAYHAATVSRAQIEAQVRAFLDAAERLPGGLGYAAIQVQMHLDPSRLVALRPPGAAVRELEAYAASRRHGGRSSKVI